MVTFTNLFDGSCYVKYNLWFLLTGILRNSMSRNVNTRLDQLYSSNIPADLPCTDRSHAFPCEQVMPMLSMCPEHVPTTCGHAVKQDETTVKHLLMGVDFSLRIQISSLVKLLEVGVIKSLVKLLPSEAAAASFQLLSSYDLCTSHDSKCNLLSVVAADLAISFGALDREISDG